MLQEKIKLSHTNAHLKLEKKYKCSFKTREERTSGNEYEHKTIINMIIIHSDIINHSKYEW